MTNNNKKESVGMQEQRREPRTELKESLTIYNSQTNQKIGQMVNLSAQGFMLSSHAPVPDGMVVQCKVTIERENRESTTIQLGAESLWQKESCGGSQSWNGFRIIDISDEDHEQLITILES